MSKAPVPAMLRRQVDWWADAWLSTKFWRLLELRAQLRVRSTTQSPGSRSGAAAPSTSTIGTARSRRPEDDFVVQHTRMTVTGLGGLDLAYFRHTDKWFTVFRGLTAVQCFREIEENEIFWPTT